MNLMPLTDIMPGSQPASTMDTPLNEKAVSEKFKSVFSRLMPVDSKETPVDQTPVNKVFQDFMDNAGNADNFDPGAVMIMLNALLQHVGDMPTGTVIDVDSMVAFVDSKQIFSKFMKCLKGGMGHQNARKLIEQLRGVPGSGRDVKKDISTLKQGASLKSGVSIPSIAVDPAADNTVGCSDGSAGTKIDSRGPVESHIASSFSASSVPDGVHGPVMTPDKISSTVPKGVVSIQARNKSESFAQPVSTGHSDSYDEPAPENFSPLHTSDNVTLQADTKRTETLSESPVVSHVKSASSSFRSQIELSPDDPLQARSVAREAQVLSVKSTDSSRKNQKGKSAAATGHTRENDDANAGKIFSTHVTEGAATGHERSSSPHMSMDKFTVVMDYSPGIEGKTGQDKGGFTLPSGESTPSPQVAVQAVTGDPVSVRSGMSMDQSVRTGVFHQLSQGVNNALSLNRNRAVIHLNPPELGSVTIRINVDHNKRVHATFMAEHVQTHQILESGMDNLRNQLAQNGFDMGQVNINLSGDGGMHDTGTPYREHAGNGRQQFQASGPDEETGTAVQASVDVNNTDAVKSVHIIM